MVLDVTLISLTLVVLFIASYTDLKTREVPDWLNYGFLFAVIGIRGIYAIQGSAMVFISGLLGFVICFALAHLFYYTNQWGGGDSKLLMGMGAAIGITYPLNNSSFDLLWFFLGLLLLGAIYGVFWMVFLAVKNHKSFADSFLAALRKYKKIHLLIFPVTVSLAVIVFLYSISWAIFIMPIILFYLLLFMTAVEKSCFIKNVNPLKLTEGDWLAADVHVDNKKVMNKKTLEKSDLQQLWKLQKAGKIKTVTIKEGIPFVPSFLFSYLALIMVVESFLY